MMTSDSKPQRAPGSATCGHKVALCGSAVLHARRSAYGKVGKVEAGYRAAVCSNHCLIGPSQIIGCGARMRTVPPESGFQRLAEFVITLTPTVNEGP